MLDLLIAVVGLGCSAWVGFRGYRLQCDLDASRYQLSRARAAASHYRTAAFIMSRSGKTFDDVDALAALMAWKEMDDLTAAELRAEAMGGGNALS